MTTNIAEVRKLAAKPIQYDNDEKTWLEFRFKLENYVTLVDERYVALLLNAESQPVANLPTGTEESAVTIRTLTHTVRLAGDTDHGKCNWRLIVKGDHAPDFGVAQGLFTESGTMARRKKRWKVNSGRK